jgi:AI-2 transport protein TqsA
VPLTIVLKIIFESFEETKWIARLMGPPGDLE